MYSYASPIFRNRYCYRPRFNSPSHSSGDFEQHDAVKNVLSRSSGNAPVQAKLNVGQPDDSLEHEADRIADVVVSGRNAQDLQAPYRSVPTVQRMCDDCEEEEALQRKTKDSTPANKSSAAVDATGALGSGFPLPKTHRRFFENRIGHDFGQVRIHTGNHAAQAAEAINAKAYTQGRHIVFNEGQYNPESRNGKHLLAHELAHVVQQKDLADQPIRRTLGDGHDLLAERFQGRLDLEAAFDDERLIQSGSSGPDVVILQLALIESGHPLPQFGADGDFGPETRSAVRSFQRANGLDPDGIVGPRTMEVLDGLFTVGPVIAPVCNDPGVARNLLLQPVFFKCGANDADQTGGSFFSQLTKANEIWSKLGVTFTTNSPVILDDCTNKSSGGTLAERNVIRGLHAGGGVEVYFVDNDLTNVGGGASIANGNNSNVILSDFGTSTTLLAHELGHVLTINAGSSHPPDNGEPGTIMEPSSSHSTPNPERNTIGNLAFIVFPVGTDPICLTPDP